MQIIFVFDVIAARNSFRIHAAPLTWDIADDDALFDGQASPRSDPRDMLQVGDDHFVARPPTETRRRQSRFRRSSSE